MKFHDSLEISYFIFFQKIGKMSINFYNLQQTTISNFAAFSKKKKIRDDICWQTILLEYQKIGK